MLNRKKVFFLILLGFAMTLFCSIPAFAASSDNPSEAKDSRSQIQDLRKQRLKALSKGDYKGAKALAAEIRALDQKEHEEKKMTQNQSAGAKEPGKEPKSLFQDDWKDIGKSLTSQKSNTSNINSNFNSGSSSGTSSGSSPSNAKTTGFSTGPSLFDTPKSSGASNSNVVQASNSRNRSNAI